MSKTSIDLPNPTQHNAEWPVDLSPPTNVPFLYDPAATYPNVGERGNSSLQAVKMLLDTHKETDKKYPLEIRYQVVVSLRRELVEALLDADPGAFDIVDPV